MKETIEVDGRSFGEIRSITIEWNASLDKTLVIKYIEDLLPDIVVQLIDSETAKLKPKTDKKLFLWTGGVFFAGMAMGLLKIATDSNHQMSLNEFPLETVHIIPRIVSIEYIEKYKYQDSIDAVLNLNFKPGKRYYIDGQIKKNKSILNVKEEDLRIILYSIEFEEDKMDAVAWASRAMQIGLIKYCDINRY